MRCLLLFVALAALIHNMYADLLYRSRMRRNAVKNKRFLWPKATVVYTIDDSISDDELEVIKEAMSEISSVSCIRFKERFRERGYVKIYKGEGCSATIGYQRRLQSLSLERGCYSLDTVIHELFHTLGFYHEHVRPDRDKYVVVYNRNIIPELRHNFRKLHHNDVNTLGLRYDYNSIMHYGDRYFAIDKSKKTLKSTSRNGDLTKVDGMSFLDIKKLNSLYSCAR